MMPSRQVMIQQAVLNAVHYVFPISLQWRTVSSLLQEDVLNDPDWQQRFFVFVREQYSLLLTREQLIESGRTCQN